MPYISYPRKTPMTEFAGSFSTLDAWIRSKCSGWGWLLAFPSGTNVGKWHSNEAPLYFSGLFFVTCRCDLRNVVAFSKYAAGILFFQHFIIQMQNKFCHSQTVGFCKLCMCEFNSLWHLHSVIIFCVSPPACPPWETGAKSMPLRNTDDGQEKR